MLAVTETSVVLIVVALIAASASIVTGLIAAMNNRQSKIARLENRVDHAHVVDALNGLSTRVESVDGRVAALSDGLTNHLEYHLLKEAS